MGESLGGRGHTGSRLAGSRQLDVVLADEVAPQVAAVVRTVRTVRAQEARLLAALHLEVLAEVALPAVHVAALVASELARLGGEHRGLLWRRHGRVHGAHRGHRHELGLLVAAVWNRNGPC